MFSIVQNRKSKNTGNGKFTTPDIRGAIYY